LVLAVQNPLVKGGFEPLVMSFSGVGCMPSIPKNSSRGAATTAGARVGCLRSSSSSTVPRMAGDAGDHSACRYTCRHVLAAMYQIE
jgi:hypothetical protein